MGQIQLTLILSGLNSETPLFVRVRSVATHLNPEIC